MVCDGLQGIEQAIAKTYSQSEVQLCVVHLSRNVQKHVKPKDKEQVALDFKAVFELSNKNDTPEKAWLRWKQFCGKWAKSYPRIGKMVESQRYRLYFTCYGYDYRIRNMLYTTKLGGAPQQRL